MVEYNPQILKQYIGNEREGSNEIIDETTKNAAFIAEQARAQVKRIKDKNHSIVKKGHATAL